MTFNSVYVEAHLDCNRLLYIRSKKQHPYVALCFATTVVPVQTVQTSSSEMEQRIYILHLLQECLMG
jgi:hypothetical protein